MQNYGRMAYLGTGIYIGSHDRCRSHPCQSAIHIAHPGETTCQHAKPGDLLLEYTERQPVPIELMNQVREFCGSAVSIFIHCVAGQCRSPMIALVAMLSRGRDPWASIAEINRATWEQYPHHIATHFECTSLADVLTWYDQLPKNPQ